MQRKVAHTFMPPKKAQTHDDRLAADTYTIESLTNFFQHYKLLKTSIPKRHGNLDSLGNPCYFCLSFL